MTGRAEMVDKDELFAEQNVPAAIANAVFRVKALTVGYSRDVITMHGLVTAIGANVTAYSETEAAGTWVYRVQAFNGVGTSGYSNSATIRVR